MSAARWFSGGLAALMVGIAGAASTPPSPACMTGRIMGLRAPLFVLATAGADTVLAGAGPVRYNDGNVDSAALAGIHGQRFRLDRIGGDVPPELAGVDGGEVVLVPYGWECGDTWRWKQARWTAPGTQIMTDVEPWPRAQWVDGRPTFSVDVIHDVYPEGYSRSADPVGEPLTPSQVFDLNAVLPTFDAVEADPVAAYRDFLGWARIHPAEAARFPASEAMNEAQAWLQPCVPAYALHPVAGTYRATVIVRGRDTLTSWFRTDPRGYPMCAPPEPRLDLAAVRPRMADTAGLYVYGSGTDAASIPVTNRDAWEGSGSCFSVRVEVINPPRTDASGRRSWAVEYDYAGFTACFRDDARVQGLADSLDAAYEANTRDDTPGWFREMAGGGMAFERTWRVRGRTILEVRATRISLETLD